MTVKHDYGQSEARLAGIEQGRTVLAAGSVLGALAASSCCLLPLVLLSLGVSGAWVGTLTLLAPYQPYFLAATIACLAGGYWLHWRSSRFECADGGRCSRPMSNRLVKFGFALATALVVAAIGFNLLAPLMLET